MIQLQRLFESASKSSFETFIVEPERENSRIGTHSTYRLFLLSPYATKALPQKWLSYSIYSVRREAQAGRLEW
jgi:hypothetical protein